ncbi:pentapeptide repeat-containing protein [Salinispora arenicola]|nr:pentapeptide repeat-containing protein [Salinispora arenicola]
MQHPLQGSTPTTTVDPDCRPHTCVSSVLSGLYDAGLYRAKLTRADLTRADLRSADLTDAACGRLESLYRPWSNAAGGGETEG